MKSVGLFFAALAIVALSIPAQASAGCKCGVVGKIKARVQVLTCRLRR